MLIASNLRGGITRADIAFSLAMSLGFNPLLGVNDLLGPGVLFAFVAGPYYPPRREERILLFIDMRTSTATAERLGEERFLDLRRRPGNPRIVRGLASSSVGPGAHSRRARQRPRWAIGSKFPQHHHPVRANRPGFPVPG